jgi:hypothetical protein
VRELAAFGKLELFVTPQGQVAQLVERSPEKAGVGGSIPSLATTSKQSTYIKIQQAKMTQNFELRPNCVQALSKSEKTRREAVPNALSGLAVVVGDVDVSMSSSPRRAITWGSSFGASCSASSGAIAAVIAGRKNEAGMRSLGVLKCHLDSVDSRAFLCRRAKLPGHCNGRLFGIASYTPS